MLMLNPHRLPLGRRDYAALISSSLKIHENLKQHETGFIKHVGAIHYPTSSCMPARIQRRLTQTSSLVEPSPHDGFTAVMRMVVPMDPKTATTTHEWYLFTQRAAKRIDKQMHLIIDLRRGREQNTIAKARASSFLKASSLNLEVALHLLRSLRFLPTDSDVHAVMRALPDILLSILADFTVWILLVLCSSFAPPGTPGIPGVPTKQHLLEKWTVTVAMLWSVIIRGPDFEELLAPEHLHFFSATVAYGYSG